VRVQGARDRWQTVFDGDGPVCRCTIEESELEIAVAGKVLFVKGKEIPILDVDGAKRAVE